MTSVLLATSNRASSSETPRRRGRTREVHEENKPQCPACGGKLRRVITASVRDQVTLTTKGCRSCGRTIVIGMQLWKCEACGTRFEATNRLSVVPATKGYLPGRGRYQPE